MDTIERSALAKDTSPSTAMAEKDAEKGINVEAKNGETPGGEFIEVT